MRIRREEQKVTGNEQREVGFLSLSRTQIKAIQKESEQSQRVVNAEEISAKLRQE